MRTFYTGTHQPHHMAQTDAPLFVSRRRLAGRKTFPRARGRWALDSGGFSELSLHGRWTVTPKQYAGEVRRFSEEIGNLDWAAVMDHMVEPWILQKTGHGVRRHQVMTVASWVHLKNLAPDLPWAPVLQGWTLSDYLRHVDMYAAAGLDLHAAPVVGVGSICRRQSGAEAAHILRTLAGLGLRLHGFGLKMQGLARVADALESADSMAWSYSARREPPLEGCTGHINCANCLRYALRWRERVLETVDGSLRRAAVAEKQGDLFSAAA